MPPGWNRRGKIKGNIFGWMPKVTRRFGVKIWNNSWQAVQQLWHCTFRLSMYVYHFLASLPQEVPGGTVSSQYIWALMIKPAVCHIYTRYLVHTRRRWLLHILCFPLPGNGRTQHPVSVWYCYSFRRLSWVSLTNNENGYNVFCTHERHLPWPRPLYVLQVEHTWFLGMSFYRRLTWIPNLRTLKATCKNIGFFFICFSTFPVELTWFFSFARTVSFYCLS